ncbi:unnamed protein product [Zymoseptoria tritici ST99CH_3D1]|nr:unnamed protein product [Zymoseptoria tritici ST99CH_3D1]
MSPPWLDKKKKSDLVNVFKEAAFQVLASLGEFALLHTLAGVPGNTRTYQHEIEFVRKSGPSLGDGVGVGQHAHGAVALARFLGEIAVGNVLWWLVADTNLEASWAPVDELDGALGLEGGNSLVDVLGHDVSMVEQASGMYFPLRGSHLSWLFGSKQNMLIS